MFGFIRKLFIGFFRVSTVENVGEALDSIRILQDVYNMCLNHWPISQARPIIVIINSDETLFYPFTASVKKYGGSCNTTDDPYAPVCVPSTVKNINAKVFKLISGVNETRYSSASLMWV